ncbi:cytokine-induced anti-apoptosis inhibitor 1, Fe-S biogenesis domain containing protein [Nitzschia inconspicua]|uniref:Anamorsin homolog n=1 Tax=Nitzschia inconspicua TaxID=303405 RepID=A0A9K3KB20_9STRA|nr:cytokine-induced anti-apoptosis inhibitor 1, Fe-S biogenesis domain containing protein [Nitzschia inconspicua]
MTAGSSLCLQLGSATTTDASSYSQVLSAKTAEELSTIKSLLLSMSIDKLDIVVESSELDTLYNPMELSNWVPSLKVDALVSVRVVNAAAVDVDLQPITTSFLLAGLSSVSERKESGGSRVLVASRKAAPIMSAAPLKKTTNVVTLNIGETGDDEDMIDEDGLLDENTLLAPPPAMNTQATANADDCSGRAPCDNCTCGRADSSASGRAPQQAPSSSCGKCHLGDAFRCASCPYLGKPAFKAGEEHLVLQLTDDL